MNGRKTEDQYLHEEMKGFAKGIERRTMWYASLKGILNEEKKMRNGSLTELKNKRWDELGARPEEGSCGVVVSPRRLRLPKTLAMLKMEGVMMMTGYWGLVQLKRIVCTELHSANEV
ncbi:hypothetical protein HYFRA_00004321 [Hymenoscyphus fraxineus]|uniref:Uncharacterized protein n=1 Tax=Hymenoscyphus fraxineus TaxID=746836 RepID=A0A9N9KMF0_9HELO|nr:hypothetical protein HYFRA_00004321 [Hymenoscyphus fraxineus]